MADSPLRPGPPLREDSVPGAPHLHEATRHRSTSVRRARRPSARRSPRCRGPRRPNEPLRLNGMCLRLRSNARSHATRSCGTRLPRAVLPLPRRIDWRIETTSRAASARIAIRSLPRATDRRVGSTTASAKALRRRAARTTSKQRPWITRTRARRAPISPTGDGRFGRRSRPSAIRPTPSVLRPSAGGVRPPSIGCALRAHGSTANRSSIVTGDEIVPASREKVLTAACRPRIPSPHARAEATRERKSPAESARFRATASVRAPRSGGRLLSRRRSRPPSRKSPASAATTIRGVSPSAQNPSGTRRRCGRVTATSPSSRASDASIVCRTRIRRRLPRSWGRVARSRSRPTRPCARRSASA